MTPEELFKNLNARVVRLDSDAEILILGLISAHLENPKIRGIENFRKIIDNEYDVLIY